MELDIVKYPDPVLKRVSKPIAEIDDDVREKARLMIDLMYRDKGVGLAAPQVGWSARLFVMNPTGKPEDVRIFVNPTISGKSKTVERSNEGCLSIPEVNGKIERALKIRIEGYDLDGQAVSLDLEGFPARICQHEFDHLEGILIIDRMSPAERSVADPVLRALRDEYAHAQECDDPDHDHGHDHGPAGKPRKPKF